MPKYEDIEPSTPSTRPIMESPPTTSELTSTLWLPSGTTLGPLPDEELMVAPITKYDDPTQVAPGFKFAAVKTNIATKSQFSTVRVAWTAPENKLVDDACRHAPKTCHGKRIARVLPFKREFANLLCVDEAKPHVTDISKNVLAAPASIALSRYSDAYPAHSKASVSVAGEERRRPTKPVALQASHRSAVSEAIDLVVEIKAEVHARLEALCTSRLTARIKENFDEDRCFSGIFMAFPNANLSEAIQIGLCIANQRHFWARLKKKLWLTINHTPAALQGLITGHGETSHLCDWRRCMNPRHILVEPHHLNISRNSCLRKAIKDAEFSRVVSRVCELHDPPCLLHQAALPVESRILLEYERLGHGLPTDKLPPQIQSQDRPCLLNLGITL
ncbi:hypothetical protein FSARC_11045 [Fusarium sarcochroum]|uniref:Zinc-binding loop region of homing endonuclease domain-containing protein n=1 Tax=Fusarium sarcochroum TaxID=1208366 RepID=A0A8H4X1B6_9HYPO|nr:hypothetical protein FSARC_11045 [Fusarium sarcochroum]